jgi:hypothetical protein
MDDEIFSSLRVANPCTFHANTRSSTIRREANRTKLTECDSQMRFQYHDGTDCVMPRQFCLVRLSAWTISFPLPAAVLPCPCAVISEVGDGEETGPWAVLPEMAARYGTIPGITLLTARQGS